MHYVTVTEFQRTESELEKYQGWKNVFTEILMFEDDQRKEAHEAYDQEVFGRMGKIDPEKPGTDDENYGHLNRWTTRININEGNFILVSLVRTWKVYELDAQDRLKPGTQILYVPNHAKGDLKHPDVLEGFIYNARPDLGYAHCRYFYQKDPKRWGDAAGTLRTVANSEATNLGDIVIKDHRNQDYINEMLKQINQEKANLEKLYNS